MQRTDRSEKKRKKKRSSSSTAAELEKLDGCGEEGNKVGGRFPVQLWEVGAQFGHDLDQRGVNCGRQQNRQVSENTPTEMDEAASESDIKGETGFRNSAG
jgi:hypothetical protein